jgi:hypothetical protein
MQLFFSCNYINIRAHQYQKIFSLCGPPFFCGSLWAIQEGELKAKKRTLITLIVMIRTDNLN